LPQRLSPFRKRRGEKVEKLRGYAEDANRQNLLRKVLVFFPALAPEGRANTCKVTQSSCDGAPPVAP